jgi:broad specificity phosphatase PhoE
VIVYFTRHGESVANVADRTMQAEPHDADRLSELGHRQAHGLGERLKDEGIEAILASPFGRAQETAQGIGEVLGLGYETDEDLYEVRQSDAYRAASPNYEGTGHVSWMPANPPEHAEPGAESFAQILQRVANVQRRLEERIASERILCVSHWGFLHFFLGAAIFREEFSPRHLPALYRISHINTGITVFHKRRDYLIEGIRFDGWALQTWNDLAHL